MTILTDALTRLRRRRLCGAVMLFALLPLLSSVSAQRSPTAPGAKSAAGKDGYIPGINPDDVSDMRGRTPFQALDHPAVLPVQQASFLSEEEPVIGVEVAGMRRAYPLRMVAWHHIVNDTVGGRPLVVTYCSACNAGVAFDPVIQGKTHFFSLYGFYNRSFVMQDRETESLWFQLDGKAIKGKLRNRNLPIIPMLITTWGQWMRLYPRSDVLASAVEAFAKYPAMDRASAGKTVSVGRKRIALVAGIVACFGMLFWLLRHSARGKGPNAEGVVREAAERAAIQETVLPRRE